MIDISLKFNPETYFFDLVLAGEGQEVDLQGDDGLLTSIIISLFTDSLAHADDVLPDERVGTPTDRRGWWGDCILEADKVDPMGSRLWLLWREKELPSVVARAEQYAKEALQWLIKEGHVSKLVVTAHHVGASYLGIGVQALPASSASNVTREWNFVFDYKNAGPVTIKSPI